ncbi:MAG: DinB family protein [Candidatus Palauibacterales bacterium]|nr:DinB family protein [Candidatus Palauibacterales bacterium]MDP2585006.1 DinB family protein [Candidatus Palauibacterales bacterium]
MEFDLANGIAVLRRTPGVLRTLLAGLGVGWTHANEGPDTWSPFDVLGHLIDGEEKDWMARARIILARGPDRRFELFDRFRHLRTNRGRTLDEALDRFAELRVRNLQELQALELGLEELALTGEHPEFGRVTLEQLLATWVAHDLGHIAQVARVMARQYREAVGPWEAYLPVLHR